MLASQYTFLIFLHVCFGFRGRILMEFPGGVVMSSKAAATLFYAGIVFAAVALAAPQDDQPVFQPSGGTRTGRTVRDGIAVEYSIEPAVAGKAGPLRAGDDVALRFHISDDATK